MTETVTPGELRILALLAKGQDNKQIAAELGLKECSIKNVLYRIFDKLAVHNRVLAARWYWERYEQ